MRATRFRSARLAMLVAATAAIAGAAAPPIAGEAVLETDFEAAEGRKPKQEGSMEKTIYDFTVKNIAGEDVAIADFKGRVLLIVNTASHCGFTKQYKGLEVLHRQYADRGLTVLGFPCNQFGGQEPGTAEEIVSFCEQNYGVTFPLMAKIKVNGKEADPLYVFLKERALGDVGSAIKWNFTKFLVSRDGRAITRYASATTPEELAKPIETLLGD